jgi:hypothetical protein
MKVLRTIAVVFGVLIFWILVNLLGRRDANFYVMVIAVIVLPAMYWMRRPLTWPAIVLAAIAFAITLSPIDLKVQQTGKREIGVKPAHYGRYCNPAVAACYGDLVLRNDPRYALVISP